MATPFYILRGELRNQTVWFLTLFQFWLKFGCSRLSLTIGPQTYHARPPFSIKSPLVTLVFGQRCVDMVQRSQYEKTRRLSL